MSESDREKWEEKYRGMDVPEISAPDPWLVRNVEGLTPGCALELACGLGHNTIWLAQRGWQVDAVDVSAVGLNLAAQLARKVDAPPVNWVVADLDDFPFGAARYDLVVVFRFLDRGRVPEQIESALRPGGRLVYETFLRAHCDRPDTHLKNPAFTLQPGELPELFPGLVTIDYGESELSDRTVAQLVCRKPT